MSLKSVLFQKYAQNGLNDQLKAFQKRYKPKKGRRFNEKNITYEIGNPKVVESSVEFEVSSKIPHDELKGKEGMKNYFNAVKDLLLKSSFKPKLVEMENIVWDADKDTEKNRDYVKANYSVNFKDLYSDKEISSQAEKVQKNPEKYQVPQATGVATLQGRLLLQAVKEKIAEKGDESIGTFVEANQKVRSKLCKR